MSNLMKPNSAELSKSFERLQQLILSEFTETNKKKLSSFEERLDTKINTFQKKISQQIDSLIKKTNMQYEENDHAIKSLSQAMMEEFKSTSKKFSKINEETISKINSASKRLDDYAQNAKDIRKETIDSLASIESELKSKTESIHSSQEDLSNKVEEIKKSSNHKFVEHLSTLAKVEKAQESTISKLDLINGELKNSCEKLSNTKVDRNELINLLEGMVQSIKEN